MSVESYRALLADFEVYLNHETSEWGNLVEASTDKIHIPTYHALLDMKDELDRLKRLYLEANARSKSSIS
jgi:hypothetical protein